MGGLWGVEAEQYGHHRHPDLTCGSFIYGGKSRVGITLDSDIASSELYLGDWSFDFDNDGVWDYVLHHDPRRPLYGTSAIPNTPVPEPGAGLRKLHSIRMSRAGQSADCPARYL